MTNGDWNLPTRAANIGLILLVSIASVWLAAELPPQAFYSGDSGVKHIARREVRMVKVTCAPERETN
jgi:hypothetical protein